MAEAHSPKPVKEKVEEEGSKDKEEKKGEKKKRRRKPNPPPSSISISIPDRPSPYSLLNDKNSGCGSFSQLLAGAMASPATPNSGSPAVLEMKPTIVLTLPVDPSRFPVVAQPAFIGVLTPGQFGMSHQEALASVTAQAQLQLQTGFPPSPLTIPTKSLTEPLLSAFSPTPLQQRMPSVSEDHVSKSEVDQHANSDQKRQTVHGIVKTPSGDGFNWRKYGQKQVKSSESSRSYYRCTHANCSAKKKVERSHGGNINEIIYKCQHNHEPPHKIRCKKESEPPFGGPSGGNETVESPAEDIRESNPSTPKREHSSNHPTPESQLQSSSNCHGNAGTLADEDQCDEREPKRRIKENTVASSPSLLKTLKEPKVVVQTGNDSGSLGDGYRWRKYGQKIVKGNPHPRSYYKCTYVGCPVRKHVERASDDEKAHIITYEGKHNHDPPASKDSHDPSTLISDATPVSTSGQSKTSNLLPDETPSTRSPSHVEGKLAGEKASELGGEKTFESAQTLLSIGFISNSSEEDAGTKNPNAIQQPLFNENSAAVSV